MTDAAAGGQVEPAGPRDDVVYVEPARSYRSMAITLLVIAAAFGLDAVLSGRGALDHLPGWAVAAAIILGAHAIFVYAVRSTHSLTVTRDQVRIGDEWLDRADIASLGVESDGLPVLGWPNTRPRQIKSVVVRMADEQEVVVPTRFPDRLAAVLGVRTAPRREVGEEPVRDAGPDDLLVLAEIDARADTVFRVAGYELPPIPFDVAAARSAAALFVVGRPALAFAQLDVVDGAAYLAALAVVPSAMRQGLGTRLLEHCAQWARERGHPALTLTTFADVPWNAPYYAARGFAETSDAGPGLARLRDRERALGLDAVGRRVVMRREL